MSEFTFYIGDAFTNPKKPSFSGNPAAVVILKNDVRHFCFSKFFLKKP